MSLTVEFGRSFGELDGAAWDRCAGTENPFLSFAFMSALEESGCIGGRSGWLPLPALLKEADQVVAATPAFIKLHSKGEYIFDYGWADAYPRFLGPEHDYYPKLQVAVPFSPVPGPRFLVVPGFDPLRARKALKMALIDMVGQLEMSSVHVTFCQSQETADSPHYLERLGEQYHWFNRGYDDFEEFLTSLKSRKRKTIRRERRQVASYPLTIHTLHGDEVQPEQWEAFAQMYLRTSMRKWGQPYLNLEFFKILGQRLGPRLVLFLVQRDDNGEWIAGAWNLRGDEALFGRNWGCLEHHEFLHFEVCYYRAMEYAIEHRLTRVEAGAQGTHKIPRGYEPVPIHSIHHLRSSSFEQIIAEHLEEERQEYRLRRERLRELLPFRQIPLTSRGCEQVAGTEASRERD